MSPTSASTGSTPTAGAGWPATRSPCHFRSPRRFRWPRARLPSNHAWGPPQAGATRQDQAGALAARTTLALACNRGVTFATRAGPSSSRPNRSTKRRPRPGGREGPPAGRPADVRGRPAGRLGGAHDRAVEAVAHVVGGSDLDIGEAGGLEAGAILGERQRPRDAAGEAAALGALGGGQVVVGDHVAHPDPPARSQDPGDLGEDGRLVRRQVDDAVADDDVDRGVAERDRFDPALPELDVGRAGLRPRCGGRA